MTKVNAIKIISFLYLTIGVVYFGFWHHFYAVLNFIIGFSVVFVNFVYLEKLTSKIILKEKSGAMLVVIINLIRYPLIGLILFGIINWKNFDQIPFIAGFSAIVVGLLTIPFIGGKSKNES